MGLDTDCSTHCTFLGAMTGSNSTELPVFVAAQALVITGVKIVDITGVTGHTTNYGTATLYNRGTAAGGSDVVAQRATNVATTNDITAKKPWTVTLATTAANLEVAAGEELGFCWTEAGSGQDLAGVLVCLSYVNGTGAGN
jgi:hypothetical protein